MSSNITPKQITHKKLLKVRRHIQEREAIADSRSFERKSIPRTYKVIKPKVMEEFEDCNQQIEDDFILETQGNEVEFLNTRTRYATLNPAKCKNTAWDIVGSKEGFERFQLNLTNGSQIYDQGPKTLRPISTKQSSRFLEKQSPIPVINYEESYNSKIQQVQEGRIKEKLESRRRFTKLTFSDRLTVQRQGKVLENFEEMNKTWDKIQDAFSSKLRRAPEDLAFNRGRTHREKLEDIDFIEKSIPTEQRDGSCGWYMTLRSTGQEKYYSTYLPVGNHLSGLYAYKKGAKKETLEVIRRPGSTSSSFRSFKDDPYLQSRLSVKTNFPRLSAISKFDDLVVYGESKLPLEIEAVKNVGFENVRTQLIEPGNDKEEVITQNYSSKLRHFFE